MECMKNDSELHQLRHANLQLDRFLTRFSRAAVLGTDEEVTAVLQLERTLRSVGVLLKQGVQRSQNGEVQSELAIYRANLIKLRRELAELREAASVSQARLFARQKHLHAAQAWCAASRATR